jgi:shikimate dehydrogenase
LNDPGQQGSSPESDLVKLAVLGDPVSHSKSPAIHNAALAAVGIAGTYEARKVDDGGVRAAFDEVRSGALSGFNVTMPHKGLAAELCDRLDPDASRAGSVNTVALIDGALWGFSTDVGGIRDAWGELPAAAPVLILGAGGAAAASCVALSDRPVYLAARRFGAGADLARRLEARGLEITLGEVRWGVPVVGSVVVNCTPIGMRGESLPEGVLAGCAGLFDMAYGSMVTPAVLATRKMGREVVEGIDLLVFQAARSFAIWTGLNPPIEVMRKAAKNP